MNVGRDNQFQLQTVAKQESALLAPYAFPSAKSAGRRFAEPDHPYRSPFCRDRDRILHSAAFRRLSGKMQVFTGDRGDYHRTRLTHTMEVASIARTIGRALRLNEDLIEALALLHDIGHPPFGHAGEDALNEYLADEGGFSHNRYALTLVEELERPYGQFPGLNLTQEVLDGQRIRIDKSNDQHAVPVLEVQVVDAADSITYDAHDTDDAVKLGLVTLDQLCELRIVQECISRVGESFQTLHNDRQRRRLTHSLINLQVNDVLYETAKVLQKSSRLSHPNKFRVISSQELEESKKELEEFLYANVYRHPELVRVRNLAQQQIHRIVDRYVKMPHLLPDGFQNRVNHLGGMRSAVDYVAGMTDRFCQSQYDWLTSSEGLVR